VEELTKSSLAEAAAKSAPFLVIVAVLELLDGVVIVPLTESVGSLKTMSVRKDAGLSVGDTYETGDTEALVIELRCLASAVLNLEDIFKVSPAFIEDGSREVNLSVLPVVGVVEGVGVLDIRVNPPLVAAVSSTETVT
jgi:hypothetical protein